MTASGRAPVRVVGFIDMDCFYVAVERARNPQLQGVPCAVVQYNTAERGAPDLLADMCRVRKGSDPMGGIIAVSYEARARGVTRSMSGKEAVKACPDITLVQVPTAFGKADLRIYKKGGDDVVTLLSKRTDATEKRSVDEVAIDITSEAQRILVERDWQSDILPHAKQVSHLADSALSRKAAAVSREQTRKGHDGQQKVDSDTTAADSGQSPDDGWQRLDKQISACDDAFPTERLLVAGAIVVAELRAEVKATLGFTCSGGVATNKILAKLGCGLHKPDQQTILLPHSVPLLLQDMPLDRLTGLGGQFGESITSTLGVTTVGELLAKPRAEVLHSFPDRGSWLLEFAAGKDSAVDAVKDRQLTKSLANGKTFFRNRRLVSVEEVEHWLQEFSGELHIRYQEQVELHQRAPTTISVSIGLGGGNSGREPQADEPQGNHWDLSEAHRKQQGIDLGRHGTVAQIASAAKACFHKWLSSLHGKPFAITSLGISLTGMVAIEGRVPITRFFARGSSAHAPLVSAAGAANASGTASKASTVAAPSAAGSSPAVSNTAPPSAASAKLTSSDGLKGHMTRLFGSKTVDPQKQFVDTSISRGGESVEVLVDSPPSSQAKPSRHDTAPASRGSVVSDDTLHDLYSNLVDESVLAELPVDIQQEIRKQMHDSQQLASASIRGSVLGTTCRAAASTVTQVSTDLNAAKRRRGIEPHQSMLDCRAAPDTVTPVSSGPHVAKRPKRPQVSEHPPEALVDEITID